MNEKKQNINLYKQLATRQDEANRMLEDEVNTMKQQSMAVHAVNPDELERIRQEEEELRMLENELKMAKVDRFQEYQQMHWEDSDQPPTQNILGREAYADHMIPQTQQQGPGFHQGNQGYQPGNESFQQVNESFQQVNQSYRQVNESYQQPFHHEPSNVQMGNPNRYDDGSEIQNPIESRVINQQGPPPGASAQMFNRGQNESFRSTGQHPGQFHPPPQHQPPHMQPARGPYNNQPNNFRSQNSFRNQQSGYPQRSPGQRPNPLQRIPNGGQMPPSRNFARNPQGPPRAGNPGMQGSFRANRPNSRNARSQKFNPLMRRI